MIICYMGTPGSGKSYESILRILENMKRGRRVYAFLDGLELTECREIIRVYTGLYGDIDDRLVYVPKEELHTFYEKVEPGSFIVIDEVQKFVSNREWNSEKNKKFADWCSTHRHIGCDVLLITQHLDKIDSHIRSMIEWTYKFRKINFFGSLVSQKYLEFVYAQDDVGGECLSRKTKTYDKKIFPCYKSYAGKEIKELKVIKQMNLFKHPVFYALGGVVLVFCYLAAKSPTLKGDLFGAKHVQMQNDFKSKSVSYLGVKNANAEPVKNNPDNMELVKKSNEKIDANRLDQADIRVDTKNEDSVEPLKTSISKNEENVSFSQAPARKKLVLMREGLSLSEKKYADIFVECSDNVCSVRE